MPKAKANTMTSSTLQTTVDKAILLDREIKERQELLKDLKSDLIEEANKRSTEHIATEGGGSSWTVTGSNGCIARVTFPADSLKSEVKGEGSAIEKIRKIAKNVFHLLFQPAIAYKPVPEFRKQAVTLLGEKDGRRLIRLLESDTSPRVNFETAKTEVEV